MECRALDRQRRGLYHLARGVAARVEPYEAFFALLHDVGITQTPDGVAYNDSGLDVDALNEMIKEL